MNIEINSSYTFATLLDSKIKMQNVHVSTVEIKHMQLGNLISKLEKRLNQGRSAGKSADDGGPGNFTDVWTMKMTSPGISFFWGTLRWTRFS